MRTTLIVACVLIFIVSGCSAPTPAAATPTAEPTPAPTPIIENPPPCRGADLIYHLQLQELLLVNCVMDPGKESPLTIWGWDGNEWICSVNC